MSWVSVGDAKNKPGSISDDGQVMLNIEVAGAVAPGADIVVYFARNTDDGFVKAIEVATRDQGSHPSVLLITWGAPEGSWSAESVKRMNEALREAAEAGITIVCAAGDSGASGGMADGHWHALFPASSPWVLACGGTRIKAAKGRIADEVVWNDTPESASATGGGTSALFAPPD